MKSNFFGGKTLKLEIKKVTSEKVHIEVEHELDMEYIMQEIYNKHNLTEIKDVQS